MCAGSALVETVVALPVLLLLTLGAVQWGLIYEAKANLEYAALMAARAGSVQHADPEAIRKGLARGLLGLYSPPKNVPGAVRTLRREVMPDVTDHTRIRILNPTIEAFEDFAVPNDDGVEEIPNRDLHMRSPDRGPSSGLNVQDANLLKVEILYGYELKVPLAGPLIASLARWWNRDADAQAMLAERRLPILASAVVRMQSPPRENDLMVRRDGSTPGRDLAGGTPGSHPSAGDGPTAPGSSQGGERQPPSGGWSPVAQRTVPYRPSPAPQPVAGPSSPGAEPVPRIVDDPGAGEFPSCSVDDRLAAVAPNQPAQQVGNPIHVVTGNKYQREVDLEPLPGVLGLRFVRHYNSRVHRLRPIGFGWRHSYDVSVRPQADGRVFLYQADGRRIDFTQQYAPPPNPKPTGVASRAVAVRPGEAEGVLLGAVRIEDGALELLSAKRGYVWHWRNGRTLHFDARGRLRRIEAPGGARTTLNYDPDGRLVQIQDPQSRYLQLFYDRFDRLVRTRDPGGLHTAYVYDTRNNLTAVHYADETVRRYHYDDPHDAHNLTGISDERERRLSTYAYDQQDRAVRSTHPGNVDKITLVYESDRTLVTDAEGRTSTYHTALAGNVPLVTRIDGPGCTPCAAADVRYGYNERYQLRATAHGDGSRTEHTYDPLGRLLATDRVRQDRRSREVAYRYRGRSTDVSAIIVPSIAPQRHRRVNIRYNAAGQIISVNDSGFAPQPDGSYRPIGRQRAFRYNGRGQLVQATIPGLDESSSVEVAWDRHGRLQKILYPGGEQFSVMAYDAYQRPTALQLGTGAPIGIEYTARGTVKRVFTSQGEIHLRWAAAGVLKGVRLNGSHMLTVPQDPLHSPPPSPIDDRQPGSQASPALAMGPSQVSLSSPRRDAFMAQVRTAGGRVTLRDGNGHATTYGIDDFGSTRFQQSPDAGITLYRYDAAGRLTAKRSARGTEARFLYAPDGRLRGAELPHNRYEMHAQGAESVVRSGDSEERVHQGDHHRVRVIDHRLGGRHRTEKFYDGHGRLIRKRLPSGTELHFRYGSAKAMGAVDILRGDPVGASAIVSTREAPNGGAVSRFGNGIRSERVISDGRLRRLVTERVGNWTYRYGSGNRIQGIDYNGKPHHRYRYDSQGRLSFALTPSQLLGYRYDQNGNRVRKIVNGVHAQYSYQPGTNRLSGARARGDTMVVQYDRNGAPVRLGPNTLEHNHNGQLVAVRRHGRLLARYAYNANAERIRKTMYDQGQPRSTGFIHEQGRLLAETGPDGTVIREYVHLDGRPVAVLEGRDIYFIHTNHLNAPVAVTDQRKQVIWRADYLPFGAAQVHEDWDGDGKAFEMNLRLPGQYEDTETGLYYNYFRYYDPASGRYLTPDPLGWAAGSNPYLYAAADPVHFVDPHGLLLFAFDGTGNTDDQDRLDEKNTTISNVVRFRESYVAPAGERATPMGGHHYYITGVGEADPHFGEGPFWDEAFGDTLQERTYYLVNRLFQYLEHIQNLGVAGTTLQIDAVGFSRGAASARVFVNVVNEIMELSSSQRFDDWTASHVSPLRPYYSALRNRWSRLGDPAVFGNRSGRNRTPDIERALDWVADRFQYLQDNCVHLNLRFLGLFDTVPHYGVPQDDDLQQLALGIPLSVEHVAHAVALNEHRAAFDGVSIHNAPGTANTPSRFEQGFIGAHSDIGGGYGEGDLNHVAFSWMLRNARLAELGVDDSLVRRKGWHKVVNPILHDSVDVYPVWGLRFMGPDRVFRYLNGQVERQKAWSGVGMGQRETHILHDVQFLEPGPCHAIAVWSDCQVKSRDLSGDRTKVGAVGSAYSDWLAEHYGLEISIDHSLLDWERRAAEAGASQ